MPDREPAPHIEVSNNELSTIRNAMRELHQMIVRLEAGEQEKVVLTKRGEMVAIVLPLETYAALSALRKRVSSD